MQSLLQRTVVAFHMMSVHQEPTGRPSLGILVFLVLLLVTGTYYSEICFDQSTNVRFLLDLFQGYGPVISYLVIVLEAIKSRRSIAKVWRLANEILDVFDRDLRASVAAEFSKCVRLFVVYAALMSATMLAVDLTIMHGVRRHELWFYNRLLSFPGFFGCRVSLLYFILLVRIFHFLLRAILNHQRRITFQLQHRITTEEPSHSRRLVEMQLQLRRAFNKLTLMNSLINASFKYSLTCAFVTNVVCIAISWIWNYLSIRFGNALPIGG